MTSRYSVQNRREEKEKKGKKGKRKEKEEGEASPVRKASHVCSFLPPHRFLEISLLSRAAGL